MSILDKFLWPKSKVHSVIEGFEEQYGVATRDKVLEEARKRYPDLTDEAIKEAIQELLVEAKIYEPKEGSLVTVGRARGERFKQEFVVKTSRGSEVKVNYEPAFHHHFEFYGRISTTGYRSYFPIHSESELAEIARDPKEYARKMADQLEEELEAEISKRKRRPMEFLEEMSSFAPTGWETRPIPEELKPLAEIARRYKTAREFRDVIHEAVTSKRRTPEQQRMVDLILRFNTSEETTYPKPALENFWKVALLWPGAKPISEMPEREELGEKLKEFERRLGEI